MEPITLEVEQKVGQYLVEVEKIQALEITNQNEFEISEAAIKNVRTKYKEIEAERVKITGPMDQAKKAVMDLFRKPLMVLEAIETKINTGRKAYLNKKEQERLEAEKKLAKEAKKEGTVAPVVQSAAVMSDKRVNRKTWKLIIDDKAAIPEKYKLVNEALLLAERRATPESQELKVKGVTFKYEY
jgi:hypothetical protein